VIRVYEVVFSRKAVKFIESIDKGYRKKIKGILGTMMENPFGYPYKKIKGETNIYRVRTGKYRILFEVNKSNKFIVILKIDKRGRVYNR